MCAPSARRSFNCLALDGTDVQTSAGRTPAGGITRFSPQYCMTLISANITTCSTCTTHWASAAPRRRSGAVGRNGATFSISGPLIVGNRKEAADLFWSHETNFACDGRNECNRWQITAADPVHGRVDETQPRLCVLIAAAESQELSHPKMMTSSSNMRPVRPGRLFWK
jgi:hypothetical protein